MALGVVLKIFKIRLTGTTATYKCSIEISLSHMGEETSSAKQQPQVFVRRYQCSGEIGTILDLTRIDCLGKLCRGKYTLTPDSITDVHLLILRQSETSWLGILIKDEENNNSFVPGLTA